MAKNSFLHYTLKPFKDFMNTRCMTLSKTYFFIHFSNITSFVQNIVLKASI